MYKIAKTQKDIYVCYVTWYSKWLHFKLIRINTEIYIHNQLNFQLCEAAESIAFLENKQCTEFLLAFLPLI